MNHLILFLDFFTCVGVVVSLNLISKTYKAWILYMIACITQLIVCGYKGVPGMGMMAVILFFTGYRNYRNAKKLALQLRLVGELGKVGDKVFGKNRQSQIPREGGIIDRVTYPGYYYIDCLDGSGIGFRDGNELIKG